MKYKFQVITFEDHFHDAEWVYPDHYNPKPCVVSYSGWVTRETDKFVVLSQGKTVKDRAEDVEYDGHMHIMKENIKKRKTIKMEA